MPLITLNSFFLVKHKFEEKEEMSFVVPSHFCDTTILLRVDYKGYLLGQIEWQFLNYPSNQGIG